MQKTLDQQIAEVEKKLQRLKEKNAKQETREKIILGAIVLNAIRQPNNTDKKTWVLGLLKNNTIREADKMTVEALIKKIGQQGG